MSQIKKKTNQVKKNYKSRNFTFTRNNYNNTVFEDTLVCRYICYGKEVGKEGTPHLQGVVLFQNPRSLASVRKLFNGCHIETARSAVHAIEYCKKEGDFTERGDPPMTDIQKGKKGKEYWDEQLILIKSGMINLVDSKLQITMPRNLDYIWNKERAKILLADTTQKHQWYYGKTNSGKSRKARTDHPNAYLKVADTKWWDGYIDQEVVIIEDFDKYHIKQSYNLKIWADRYPFPAEMKGQGQVNIRPGLIIVTSNYHPRDIWESEKDLDPILRRFHTTQFHTGLNQ